MSLNLFVVAYKSQEAQNIFFDRLWASKKQYLRLQEKLNTDKRAVVQLEERIAALERGTFGARLRALLEKWYR